MTRSSIGRVAGGTATMTRQRYAPSGKLRQAGGVRALTCCLVLAMPSLVATQCLIAAPTKPKANIGDMGFSGQTNYLTQPDPKYPGRLLWKMWVRRIAAESPAQTVNVTMDGISGVLFNKGIASAKMRAPHAEGNNSDNIIVATGGVTVESIVQKGTYIKADRVTWYATKNKGVATGNVVMHNGKSGLTIHTPRLNFDTALRSVETDAGTGTLP